MSKLKAIFIHGPPVVVDAAIRAFRRMQSRRNKIPGPEYIDPQLSDWRPVGWGPVRSRAPRKQVSEKTRKYIFAIARGMDAEMSMLDSEQEYRCSLRVFKAAWKGIPLCEEPRC